MWRKTILATALVGAGLASTTGAAFAGEARESHGHDSSHRTLGGEGCENDVAASNGGDTEQNGTVNIDDVQIIAPVNACGNNAPVNVAGVQVPIQDGALDVPILAGTGDGTSTALG